MEFLSVFTDLLANLGFPIACCVALFWYMTKAEERHKQEVDKLSKALDNNTSVLNQLAEIIKDKH